MAFPASNGSIPLTLDAAWTLARNAASAVKGQCVTYQAQAGTGTVSSQAVLNFMGVLAGLNVQLTQAAAVPGIAAYAQTQVGNPGLDVAVEFSAMQTALAAVTVWIKTNFPKDGNGKLLHEQIDVNSQTVYDNFTSAQLAPLTALVTTLSATIN